ncbi:hypothetical protein AMECASPLE_038610 [Ameca splendens]|uniref:Uncharacterized protein n=1 Tax=Ameca splendens TaxID=208324 RepID=A0ABV0ZJ12_9TELE
MSSSVRFLLTLPISIISQHRPLRWPTLSQSIPNSTLNPLPWKSTQIPQGSHSLQRGECLILLLNSFFYLERNEKRKTLISSDEFTLRHKRENRWSTVGLRSAVCVYVSVLSSLNEMEIFSERSTQCSEVKCV